MPYLAPQFLNSLNQLTPATIGLIMFPAAIASALLGKKGGRLADSKGNSVLVYTAVSLLFICFISLSTFVGASPYLILFLLIFGNVGQTFMQIAMSNTISRTLSKDQIGVGMGLLSLLNFIAGAITTSILGKTLDSSSSFHLNPVVSNVQVFNFSNIFTVLALIALVTMGLYALQFRRGARGNRPAVE
ncbi:MFS transporter [Paenibacillus polymyxa]|nr:MFS transporter [Paenibacillus polymyxa]